MLAANLAIEMAFKCLSSSWNDHLSFHRLSWFTIFIVRRSSLHSCTSLFFSFDRGVISLVTILASGANFLRFLLYQGEYLFLDVGVKTVASHIKWDETRFHYCLSIFICSRWRVRKTSTGHNFSASKCFLSETENMNAFEFGGFCCFGGWTVLFLGVFSCSEFWCFGVSTIDSIWSIRSIALARLWSIFS